jgi:hypothetical protein
VDAGAIVVLSRFAEGPAAADWLLELSVPAHAYYELDPWETLAAFDAGEGTRSRADGTLATWKGKTYVGRNVGEPSVVFFVGRRGE